MVASRMEIPFRLKYMARQAACHTAGRLAGVVLPPPVKAVIVTNGRTGSNLLVSHLNQSQEVRAYGEIFGTYYLNHDFLVRRIRDRGALWHLDDMLMRMGNERVTCVKILYRDFEERYRNIWSLPSLGQLFHRLESDDSLRIIHLVRENLLDVVLSNALAKQSGQFVGKTYEVKKISIPPRLCQRKMEGIAAREEKCRAAFRGPRYLELSYEELTSDTTNVLKRLQTFLGLAPFTVQARLKKQNKASRAESLENYDELKAYFAGTSYARFFD